MTPAAINAARGAIQSVLMIAMQTEGSPFKGKKKDDLEFADGAVRQKGQPSPTLSIAQALLLAKAQSVNFTGESKGILGDPDAKFSFHSYGAQFAEVSWEPEIARLRASRIVTVIDAGRMINPRAAKNQIEGAVVMGWVWPCWKLQNTTSARGSPINSNLADYLVAVNADCPEIDCNLP